MKTLLTLFLSILLVAGLAPAQNISSSVNGSLVDPTGSALAGAAVKLIQQWTGTTLNTVSNSEGSFTFPIVSAGTYSLRQTDFVSV